MHRDVTFSTRECRFKSTTSIGYHLFSTLGVLPPPQTEGVLLFQSTFPTSLYLIANTNYCFCPVLRFSALTEETIEFSDRSLPDPLKAFKSRRLLICVAFVQSSQFLRTVNPFFSLSHLLTRPTRSRPTKHHGQRPGSQYQKAAR